MLQAFGLFTVAAMLVCYGLEKRSHWFIVGFYVACVLAAIYCVMQGAWPFAFGEMVWALLAFIRWIKHHQEAT